MLRRLRQHFYCQPQQPWSESEAPKEAHAVRSQIAEVRFAKRRPHLASPLSSLPEDPLSIFKMLLHAVVLRVPCSDRVTNLALVGAWVLSPEPDSDLTCRAFFPSSLPRLWPPQHILQASPCCQGMGVPVGNAGVRGEDAKGPVREVEGRGQEAEKPEGPCPAPPGLSVKSLASLVEGVVRK